MREKPKKGVYLARALWAEEQAAKAKSLEERKTWSRVAQEYREAARDSDAIDGVK
jgi:hypothetical protein